MKVRSFINVLDEFWAHTSTTCQKGRDALVEMAKVTLEEEPEVAKMLREPRCRAEEDPCYQDFPPDVEMSPGTVATFRVLCSYLDEHDPGHNYAGLAGFE